MSEAAAMHAGHAESYESPLTPESWGKLGMWIFLVGDAMSFGTLLAGYGGIRYGSADWPKPYEVLGIWLTAGMTLLLIVSSVWMVKGLAAIQRNDYAAFRKFIGLTILGGVVFLGCQACDLGNVLRVHDRAGRLGDVILVDGEANDRGEQESGADAHVDILKGDLEFGKVRHDLLCE